jgi:F0F1-type ATP synthase membrane subunit b/b'
MESTTERDPTTLPPSSERRLAPRSSVAIEIVLRGSDRWGKAFIEKTQTVNISSTGAKTLTEHEVKLGTRLQVALPQLQRMSWATVAWVGGKAGDRNELGITIDETADFWGVHLLDETRISQRGETAVKQSTVAREATAPPIVPPTSSAEPPSPKSGPFATEGKHESSDKLSAALGEIAQVAIEQSLAKALHSLDRRAEEITTNLSESIVRQTEERVRHSVESALRQLEAGAIEIIERNKPAWEQQLLSVTNAAQEQLKLQLAESDAHLADSSAKVRRELAGKLAELSTLLSEH